MVTTSNLALVNLCSESHVLRLICKCVPAIFVGWEISIYYQELNDMKIWMDSNIYESRF